MALIDAITQPLTAKQAAHLLRRATFGPTAQQIKDFTGLTADAAIKKLLNNETVSPNPPLDPAGATIADKPFSPLTNSTLTKYWWLGLMANQPVTLLEKMTLFWANHFVTNKATVDDYRFNYRYSAMLRKYALGNFKTFVVEVTKDPSMLRFLNGNVNEVGKPNENYGRELLELFTIGKGADGKSAFYTEDDVKTTAKVLTGWKEYGYRSETVTEISIGFVLSKHDTTDKTFSSNFGATVIKGQKDNAAGDTELTALVDMILKQNEPAMFLCRKLYRWFIAADISADVETNFITPLAAVLRANSYDIRPVLTALFKSQHFYDDTLRGAIIKSPFELILGTFRYFGWAAPDVTKDNAGFMKYTATVQDRTKILQQEILEPPTVFGWRPYYDNNLYELWISTGTLALRGAYTDAMLTGLTAGNTKYAVDTLALAKKVSDPSDPLILIGETVDSLFVVDLTAEQIKFLRDNVLTPNLPDYEWYNIYKEYTLDPTNKTKLAAVTNKLNSLYIYLLRMAEYQML